MSTSGAGAGEGQAVLDLSQPLRVHIVAFGGAAMYSMALFLDALGLRVCGIDLEDSPEAARQ